MERNKATLVMMMMVVMMVPAVVMMMAMPSYARAMHDRLAGAMHALTFRFIPRLL